MQITRELLEAALRLRPDTYWQRIIKALSAERESTIGRLTHAESLTEYQRAVLAGRIQCMDDLLDLAETTPERVEAFQSR